MPFRRQCARLALVLAMLFLLTACRSAIQPDAGDDRPLPVRISQHQSAVSGFDAFSVRGGIGIWNDTESHSARMNWQQRRGIRTIVLNGPGGIGSMQLQTLKDGRATLQIAKRPELKGSSADELLRQVLGLEQVVPLDQLSLWIRGLPGEASNVVYDAEGRLQSLVWLDERGAIWRARIKSYGDLDELQLPSLVTAQGAGYRLRLVLKDWERAPLSAGGEESDADTEKDSKRGQPLAPERLPIPGRQSGVADRVGSRRG